MFCADVAFEDALYHLIQENFIGLCPAEISAIYDFWRTNFSTGIEDRNRVTKMVSNKSLFVKTQQIPEDASCYGIDFPTWFSNSNREAKRIVILGLDPLRQENIFPYFGGDKNNDVLIGTPYALHLQKMRLAKNGKPKSYWSFIASLSHSHFVYLTDIYKSYFLYDGRRRSSDLYFQNQDLAKIQKSILVEEMKLIEPDLIITFGVKAAAALGFSGKLSKKLELMTANFGEYNYLPLVHLSGMADKKQFLVANGLQRDFSKTYGEQYFEIVEPFLTPSLNTH